MEQKAMAATTAVATAAGEMKKKEILGGKWQRKSGVGKRLGMIWKKKREGKARGGVDDGERCGLVGGTI